MRLLICGYRAFAARGLEEMLVAAGHEVVRFSRGPVAALDGVVTGPPCALHANPLLTGDFDAVVNYILLKGQDIAANCEYLDSLLAFCHGHHVRHLVHLSSVSVYPAHAALVTESTQVETDPSRKGSYGGLKVATDNHLQRKAPPGLTVTFVRPGFILARGLAHPFVGMAFRLPLGGLLALGRSDSVVPLITRDLLHVAIKRVLEQPPEAPRSVVLLVDPDSPTRREYLECCCHDLGAGRVVWRLPVPVWLVLAMAAECAARVLRLRLSPWKLVANACRHQSFDASRGASRLGGPLSMDWRRSLLEAFGMDAAWHSPYAAPLSAACPDTPEVTYVGYGRIVKQKHLPALHRLGYTGAVRAYDLCPPGPETSAVVLPILPETDFAGKGLLVVATPGPVHGEVLSRLSRFEGTVLVEKPLCYTRSELAAWRAYSETRQGLVSVCHNYRYKKNVRRMLAHLNAFHPGRLLHVHVFFQSPPVSNEQSAWLRDERRARTLVMDYGLHFLDLACMFSPGPWQPSDVSHVLSASGETDLVRGMLLGPDYGVSLVLRQGFLPRCARVEYVFDRYTTRLTFFPDTFVPLMTSDNPFLRVAHAWDAACATAAKIRDRLLSRDSDDSHALVYAVTNAAAAGVTSPLAVSAVAPFYEGLIALADVVYGSHLTPDQAPDSRDDVQAYPGPGGPGA